MTIKTNETEPTGTLQWLSDNHGLKSGDTVECVYDNARPDIIGHGGKLYYNYIRSGIGVPISFATLDYRIVSRAADKPKIWDDMTDAEQGALLLAKHLGKVIQMLTVDHGWQDCRDARLVGKFAYRIKTEPVVETVTLYGSASEFTYNLSMDDSHSVTFTKTNGVIDCDSVKMEVL